MRGGGVGCLRPRGGGDGFAAGSSTAAHRRGRPRPSNWLGHGALLTPSPVTPPWEVDQVRASPKAAPPEFNVGVCSAAVLPPCPFRQEWPGQARKRRKTPAAKTPALRL